MNKIHNINVTTLYLPTGVIIPWEASPAPVSIATNGNGSEINLSNSIRDVLAFEELFYELELEKPPPKSTIEINPAMGQVLILEKDGDGAMMIPLTMIVAIGTKGNLIRPVKQGLPSQNHRH